MSKRPAEEPAEGDQAKKEIQVSEEEEDTEFPISEVGREAVEYGWKITSILECYAFRSWPGSSQYDLEWKNLPGVFGSYRFDYRYDKKLGYLSWFGITLRRKGHDDQMYKTVHVKEFENQEKWKPLLEWLDRQKQLEVKYLAPFPGLYEQLQTLLTTAGFTLKESTEDDTAYSNHFLEWGAMEAPLPKRLVYCPRSCSGTMLMMRCDWYRSFKVAIRLELAKNASSRYFEFTQDQWTNEQMIKTLVDWMNK